jgi:hypothetical protein
VALLLTLSLALVAGLFGPAPPAAEPATAGRLYVVQAVAGHTADVTVDGKAVDDSLTAKGVVGPLPVASGEHAVSAAVRGGPTVSAMFSVPPGGSVDAVLHLTADPKAAPVLTAFPNDLSSVPPMRARLVVAHTAVVPPSDLRLDGRVLFPNRANGDPLATVVPAAMYSVDVVPTGAAGPVVFGPVPLSVTPGTLVRVFAIGDPAGGGMDAVVQTLPVPVQGAGMPAQVATGDGGQVQRPGGVGAEGLTVLGALTAGALLLARRRSRRS